jgi:hypothetical protein
MLITFFKNILKYIWNILNVAVPLTYQIKNGGQRTEQKQL